MNSPYVGRFAPSPTGPLHFGSLVAAVASYADARAVGGRWILRIEDVDTTRCTAAAEALILRQLAAYGFASDTPVVRQSERRAHYDAALTTLAKQGRTFACICSRKLLQTAPTNAEGETIYPGTCRASHAPHSSHALRLRVDDVASAVVNFADRALGPITQNVAQSVGDFVLRRADDCYSYQLAVTVDDALQGVTHVVRGADLLLNTPRQIYLQQALELARPSYLHIPLVRNENGEKLSKQTRAHPINTQAPLVALSDAWRFLKQPQLGQQDSVGGFWRAAAQAWQPGCLRAAEKT